MQSSWPGFVFSGSYESGCAQTSQATRQQFYAMKTKNNLRTALGRSSKYVLALSAASLLIGSALAQEATKPMKPMKGAEHLMMLGQSTPPTPEQTKEMMKRCQEMMEHKQAMQVDQKAQDTELTSRISAMNSAPEGQKLGLLAAAVTQMVEQRAAMNAHKAKMDADMMQHMMQHMRMGPECLAQCPMMKGMKDMDGHSEGAHKKHDAIRK